MFQLRYMLYFFKLDRIVRYLPMCPSCWTVASVAGQPWKHLFCYSVTISSATISHKFFCSKWDIYGLVAASLYCTRHLSLVWLYNYKCCMMIQFQRMQLSFDKAAGDFISWWLHCIHFSTTTKVPHFVILFLAFLLWQIIPSFIQESGLINSPKVS